MGYYSSKLGLGTVQFGLNYGISNNEGITPEEEIENILSYAWSANINTIDTASAYGVSEEVLGRNMKNDFRIVTKFLSAESSDLDIRDLMRFFGHKKESTFKRYVQVQKPIDSSKIIEIYGYNSILKKVS